MPHSGSRPRRRRRRFGQHFLAPDWARRVVAAIDPAPGDLFVEIGPGRGALTLPLANTGLPILAIELDRDLAADLVSRVPPNVTLLSGDALEVDMIGLASGLEPQRPPSHAAGRATRRCRVVGNLPYRVATPIIFRLLDLHRRHAFFADATIMLQREVADRLVASPGRKAYGALSVFTQMHARVSRLLDLPPRAFTPAPKIHSTVVRLVFGPPAARVVDEPLFERLVKALFAQRRKMLANALKRFDRRGPEVLARSGFDGRRRPETLQVTEIARLAELFASAGQGPVL